MDYILHNYETDNEDEAYYLSAILNSSIIDDVIKLAQARGLWDPHHICKKPLEIPIPKFDQKNSIQRRLSKLGKDCNRKVKQLLPDYHSGTTLSAGLERSLMRL